MEYKKIEGYVNNDFVTAFIYYGRDSGLNHYYFKNKMYIGDVEFTSILSVTKLKY